MIVLSFPTISLFCFVALPRCHQAQWKCSARLNQQTSRVLLTCYRSFPAELKNTTVPMEPGFILHHHLPLPRDTKGYQGYIIYIYIYTLVYDIMLNESNASSAQTPQIQQNLQPRRSHLGTLCLSSPSRSRRGTAHVEMQRLCGRDVDTIR